MITFYHGVDLDGQCSGAIVRAAMKECKEDVRLFPINYKDDFPFDEIQRDEEVVIVDFSLQKGGEFERLLEITQNVIWIDHHKTSIEKHKHLSCRLNGIRVNDRPAACVLTWQYFFTDIPVPPVVQLLGDYDTWTFQFGEDTNRLQNGIRLFNTLPDSPEWVRWLDPQYYPVEEIRQGEACLRYRNNYYESLIKAWSFRTVFEGYKAIAINAGSVSSQLFDSVKDDFDIMIPFVFDGRKYTVSLYTKKDIDVSEIAVKYGGGGHEKAAGFQCAELPFAIDSGKGVSL